MVLLVLIFDCINIIKMANTRLLLLGGSIILFLLIFANKVKIASIEFEK